MGGLLSELGKKLAERWLSLLVLPGALYLAVVTAARTLGHAHALDLHRVTGRVTAWATAPAAKTVGGQVVLLAAVLAGSAAAGLVAQGIGSLIERLVLAAGWRAWPRPLRHLADRQVSRRRRSWTAAHATYQRLRESAARARTRDERADPSPRHDAHRAMTRIAAEPPDRPTWSGDRINAVAARLHRDLNLDLAAVWPHLWLHLPETVRAEITTARASLARATTLGGWALLYLPLAIWWWPAAPLTAVLTLTTWYRTRATTDTYATLLEATTRLHAADLARHLGIDHAGPLDRDTGAALTDLLQARLPPTSDTTPALDQPSASSPPPLG